MPYARIQNGIVAEVYTPPDGQVIGNCFHADLVWTECSDDVRAGWVCSGGIFSPPPPPAPPSLAEQSSQVLAERIARGIAITSTGAPSLNATYALDDITMGEIGAVARDFGSGLGLPLEAETFGYPDATGTPRIFTGPQLVALYKAQRDLLMRLNEQAAGMRANVAPVWPDQAATIA